MSDPAAAPATPAPAPAAPAAPAEDWYTAFKDDEFSGYVQNRGPKKTPAEVAYDSYKAHRNAEKLIGGPADKMVRLPKDASDEAGRKEFYAKIGVPNDEKGYDFSGVKRADGSELDPAVKGMLGQTLLRNGVPKDAAPEIARDFAKYLDDQAKASDAEVEATKAKEADELLKSWGTNIKTNTFIANQAAEKLNLGKEVLDTLAKLPGGRTAVAQALLKMGQMMGEDKYVRNPDGQNGGIRTREQALEERSRLLADEGFRAQVEAGDARANAQLHNLARLIAAA